MASPPTKVAAALLIGALVGFGAGYAGPAIVGEARWGRGSGPDSREARAEAELARRLAEAERALVAERATAKTEREARAQAEAARALAEKELASAREQIGVVSRSGASASSKGAKTDPAPGTNGGKQAIDPAAAKEKLKSLEPEIREALEKKNGQKAMALLKELAALGKDAWPQAAALATAIAQGMEEGDGGGLGLSGIEYLKGIATTDLPGLYADAVLNPQPYDLSFRKLSVWGLFLGDKDGSIGVLLKALTTETDDQVSQMIAGLLVQNHDPANLQGLQVALNAQKNPQTRQSLVSAISEIAGEDATRALQAIAGSDPDPAIQKAAATDLLVRDAPVSGFLITSVTPGSAAQQAGLAEGDIVTSYRGMPIPNQNALGKAMTGVQPTDSIAIDVYRNGQTQQATLKAGQLWQVGANGRFARPGLR